MIELRVLTPDDWPLWRELRLAALADAPHAFGARLADWQGDGDREERWRDRLALAGSYNLVALVDGRPRGMASGVPGERPDTARLISMWVAGEARGRGVADLLIRAVEEWAAGTAGAASLHLAVAEGNAPATALYTRNGFVDAGESGEVMPDGRAERVMTKPIAAA
ncbi:N-acetyltransferase family protein [Actinacidiphila sp. bgisy160]|uniref:GNAT family N-acetyltransferase n=1 Tax=Actinacidiphila sp. bgisy160 TaxID=3413796 RepID=UPI003D762F46